MAIDARVSDLFFVASHELSKNSDGSFDRAKLVIEAQSFIAALVPMGLTANGTADELVTNFLGRTS